MDNVRPPVHALVPVKSLAESKLRLANLLTPAERAKLTLTMLEDVLGNLAATPEISRVAVVSRDPDVLDLATEKNARVFSDPEPPKPGGDGLNDALMFAAKQLGDTSALMVVPADVPLVCPADYGAALDGWKGGVSAVRAQDGGTNGLLSLGADAMPYRFGSDSLEQHRAAARALELPFHIIENAVWSRDIDSPDDLIWLAEHNDQCASAEFAAQMLSAKNILKRSA
jgi:2-phospho-L-lactate guanylyltransferase